MNGRGGGALVSGTCAEQTAFDSGDLLRVENLVVSIRGPRQTTCVVDDVSFAVRRGHTFGLVGESGSGKTMTGLAVMRLLPRNAIISGGRIIFDGENLLDFDSRQMCQIRGSRIAMVLQDSTASLDPSFTIGDQIGEAIVRHRGGDRATVRKGVIDSLRMVRMPSPEARAKNYPHQLSGGMRQRAASAVALACRPSLLIADEPTTALDVTIEAQYLRLLKRLQAEMNIGVVLISHNLNVVRHMASTVAVMYAGQIVEVGPTENVFGNPLHPYTRALLNCIPSVDQGARLDAIPGQPPDLADLSEGCRFSGRCKYARSECRIAAPRLTDRSPEHLARCFGTAPDGWIESPK